MSATCSRASNDIGFKGELAIMQSNGGVMVAATAIKRPVTMMESGPVGGIIASAEIGRRLGYANVISFDMGGTTAKASLVRDGEAGDGGRLLRRRLCLGPSGDDAGRRCRRSRRRRRLDRLDRRGRRAQGRPAERGRRARPDLLPPRRHRADRHRRQRHPRPHRRDNFLGGEMQLDRDAAHEGHAREARASRSA